MQDCVTRIRRKKRKKSSVNFVIFASLLFLLVFFISAILVLSKRSNICFEPHKFYAVYVDKNKNSSLLLDKQSSLKSLGGAGVLFQKSNEYYVIASVYNNKDDAKEIVDNLKSSFLEVDILELDCKMVSKKYQNLLKQTNEYFEIYNFLYQFLNEFESLCFDYMQSNVSEGKLMSTLVSKKIELESLVGLAKQNSNDDLLIMIDYANLFLIHFNNLFNKFYASDKKDSLIFEFGVSFCLNYIDLCNNLQ